MSDCQTTNEIQSGPCSCYITHTIYCPVRAESIACLRFGHFPVSCCDLLRPVQVFGSPSRPRRDVLCAASRVASTGEAAQRHASRNRSRSRPPPVRPYRRSSLHLGGLSQLCVARHLRRGSATCICKYRIRPFLPSPNRNGLFLFLLFFFL